jgi:uncharacterized protein YcaQ
VRITLDRLRHCAATRSLAVHSSMEEAIGALGFVQADPIRAPARAQDLILRHRVADYRAGDLELDYPRLAVSEDKLHVYGFLPSERQPLLHPRAPGLHWQRFLDAHADLRNKVLRLLRKQRCCHPRDVERALGGTAVVNAWGSKSSATTQMLEALHLQGLARVARRESGQRVYELAAPPRGRSVPAGERAERLAHWLLSVYAPMPERSLKSALHSLRSVNTPSPIETISASVRKGLFVRAVVGGEAWIWPAAEAMDREADGRVRLLAPFDPIVWDRSRFELLWRWPYRFEAYTPVARRKLGYYALPMLFRERVMGWATVESGGGGFDVKLGFVGGARPAERSFSRELEAELERLRAFAKGSSIQE